MVDFYNRVQGEKQDSGMSEPPIRDLVCGVGGCTKVCDNEYNLKQHRDGHSLTQLGKKRDEITQTQQEQVNKRTKMDEQGRGVAAAAGVKTMKSFFQKQVVSEGAVGGGAVVRDSQHQDLTAQVSFF